ncbi:hypothetical protein [Lujinxingia litoralis]|nr:hypothetical protein [Lujinxingia litoralis]
MFIFLAALLTSVALGTLLTLLSLRAVLLLIQPASKQLSAPGSSGTTID